MKIPWAVPYIDETELAEVTEAVRTNWLSMGKRVRALEEELADYLGLRHAILVSNGTVALDLALKVVGVGAGDEVIVPAMTYVATLNAVLYQGATPIFADIELETFNIDPQDIERKITPRTRAIMCIDYGGNPASHSELRDIARRHQLVLVQDAAQSLGGVYQGTRLGRQGDISTTSFHAAKTITTIEGGAVFTDDDGVAERLRILRNQGEDPKHKYWHVELGYNARMTDLHAAIGLVQWRKRDAIWARRAEIAEAYRSRLADLESTRLPVTRNSCGGHAAHREPCCRNGWFFFPILVPNRDHVAEILSVHGVETRICYPVPVYEQPFFRTRPEANGRYSCPNAVAVTSQVINLPMFHQMTTEQVDYVCQALREALAEV